MQVILPAWENPIIEWHALLALSWQATQDQEKKNNTWEREYLLTYD